MFYQKGSPKLIFFNELCFEKILSIFDFKSTISALFDMLSMLVLGQKSCIWGPTIIWIGISFFLDTVIVLSLWMKQKLEFFWDKTSLKKIWTKPHLWNKIVLKVNPMLEKGVNVLTDKSAVYSMLKKLVNTTLNWSKKKMKSS